jgi:hypothetical protein
MAWVTILKSSENPTGKKLPVGTITNVSRAKYKELLASKSAEDYSGTLPPKKKTKTNFFKPKI